MIYDYECKKCGKEISLDQPMSKELPKTLTCECGGKAVYSWSNAGQGIHIPAHMKAGNTEFNCGKMHKEQKTYY